MGERLKGKGERNTLTIYPLPLTPYPLPLSKAPVNSIPINTHAGTDALSSLISRAASA